VHPLTIIAAGLSVIYIIVAIIVFALTFDLEDAFPSVVYTVFWPALVIIFLIACVTGIPANLRKRSGQPDENELK